MPKLYSVHGAEFNDMARQFEEKYKRRSGARSSFLFHGTQRACNGGSRGGSFRACHDSDCYTCQVLRHGFQIGTGGMFGAGIYSTPTSSKADSYARNYHLRSSLHAVLICEVVCDRPQYVRNAQPGRTRPDRGYNCVKALTTSQGGMVNFPETIVYRRDAIIPVGVVIYSREGWMPVG
ncbi:hypothetical protein B0T10DRAFT_604727 [Thelonectria olida]|uniref:Poly [ADP-ribose] polymerase n=1 Tax=Thelonectria olida TaxID=1576542 RepID=A0A9P9ASK5_9HYPO|nr:hypothetical protein B0T10DRAFT_604727 [Thelonectria olida]